MKLWITLGLALGLSAQYPAIAGDRKTLREECTQSRCVYYDGSRRVFSVEREEGTSRLVIRDSDRRIRGKVRKRDGTVEVEKPDNRR